MRPLAVLLGIVMGSTVSIAVGLILTWIVLLFVPEYTEVFAAERGPLAQGIAIFTVAATAACTSFYGELRRKNWRLKAHLTVVAALAVAVWVYWPD
jgi:putative effector of murein hydrolase LrgA (UPF0299 family)